MWKVLRAAVTRRATRSHALIAATALAVAFGSPLGAQAPTITSARSGISLAGGQPQAARGTLPALDPPSCEGSLVRAVLIGAAVGVVFTGVIIIAASPLIAVASIGAGRRFDATPILIGGGVVGAIVGGVGWRRSCTFPRR